MSTSTDVPLTITPAAAARTAELGMENELQQMIDHVRQVVPGLTDIVVEIAECYDSRDEPGVSIVAYSDRVFGSDSTLSWDTIRWEVNTFPPQVLEHLCILFSPGRPYAG